MWTHLIGGTIASSDDWKPWQTSTVSCVALYEAYGSNDFAITCCWQTSTVSYVTLYEAYETTYVYNHMLLADQHGELCHTL
jgi:hypothetical protein